MRNKHTKISLFILIGISIVACSTLKRVPNGEKLLTKNEIQVNNKKVSTDSITSLLYQKPNSSILGYNLRLNIYNLAKLNHDSIYKVKFSKNPEKYKRKSKWMSAKQVNRLGHSFWYSGIHEFLKDAGEAPVILDSKSTEKTLLRLKSYYFNKGFFDVETSYELDSLALKKAKVKYAITTGISYRIESIKTEIATPVLDSLYQTILKNSFIKTGEIYKTNNFDQEKRRITSHFRNNGVFNFQPNNINFDVDTINGNHKVNVLLKISNYSYRDGDSTKTRPYKIYKTSEVNIHTDYNPTDTSKVAEKKTSYFAFNLFSKGKLKYRPKAITNAIFITKESFYSDLRTTLTTRYLSNLRVFNYPTIQYKIDPKDSLSNSLIADILLTQREKFSFGYAIDFTHSNIQDFGISGNLSFAIRNVFNGAETFEIGIRSNVGSSKDLANPDNRFFNVLDYGADLKLNFPRIFMFFNTDRIVPKRMIPSTAMSLGFSKQQNIGLDKENFTGILSYNWTVNRTTSLRFDLFNIQYVKNINPGNYFNVYRSSYDALNSFAQTYNANPDYFNNEGKLIIPSGVYNFVNDVAGGILTPNSADLKSINGIVERANRLAENNLISTSSLSIAKSTKKELTDENFHVFKSKIESAGNFLSLVANLSEKTGTQNKAKTIFEVEYSQYIKGEAEYIKHWDFGGKKVLAFRSFSGLAIPYGNSDNIPFSRSYFAGGSNDNRAWQSYSLGPGKSATINDFNEANFKLALSTEYRFNFFGKFNGAVFVDAGNIWNVFDNITDENALFKGIKSFSEIAVGSGFGLRYDLNFFVFRFDFGFKTYVPSESSNQKWFRVYNFSNSVLNIGINYPF